MSIHASALVDPAAQIDPSARLGPRVIIDGPVSIGPGCHIGPAAIIAGHTKIGADCRIHSHAVIGEVPQDLKYQGAESYCHIGDGCVIREGVTVHRATIPGNTTRVGNRCSLMTNSHVAHDCVLEDDVTLISGVLLGGHVHIGRCATISGNVGIHQFVRIGQFAMIGAAAMIAQDVPPFMLTDHQGTLAGLNSVGLNRAGIAGEEQREIMTLFKLIYRSGIPFQKAIDLATELAVTASGKTFVEFFDSSSSRGYRKELDRRNMPE